MFELYFPKKTKDIQVSLSENVEGSVELNQNMLCVYGLSKGYNTGRSEYINLESSGNDKGDDQKGHIFACYQYYYDYYYYHTTSFTVLRRNLNQIKR